MVFYVHGRILGGHTRFYFGSTHGNIDTLSRNLVYIFEKEEYLKVKVQNIKLMILLAIGREDKWVGIIKCDLQTLNWHNKWLHGNYYFEVNYQILCNEKNKHHVQSIFRRGCNNKFESRRRNRC